jgi:hypothetical protein
MMNLNNIVLAGVILTTLGIGNKAVTLIVGILLLLVGFGILN